MRALVTGGAGFIGSALVRALADAGRHVRVFDDASRGRWTRLEELGDRIERSHGSVIDAAAMVEAARGMDVVFHLAAVNGTERFYADPEHVLRVNTLGVINAVDACVAAGVSRLVLSSSSEVYGTPERIPTPEESRLVVPDVTNPRFSYSGSKILGELFVLNAARSRALEPMILRYHNVYGPDMGGEHVIPQLIRRLVDPESPDEEGVLTLQGSGEETRSFCYVDDAVRATLMVLESGASEVIYNVGNEDEITIRSLAERIVETLDVGAEFRTGPLLPGSVSRRCPDTTRLRALGYRPTVDLAEGIRRCCRWYAASSGRSL